MAFFYKDKLFFPAVTSRAMGCGGWVNRPSDVSKMFSNIGFVVPLRSYGPSLKHIFDDTVPLSDKGLTTQTDYILVDHKGDVWLIDCLSNDSDSPNVNNTRPYKIDQHLMDTGTGAQWILGEHGSREQRVAALFAIDECPDKTVELYKKYVTSSQLIYLSIDEIVTRLNEMYPISSD